MERKVLQTQIAGDQPKVILQWEIGMSGTHGQVIEQEVFKDKGRYNFVKMNNQDKFLPERWKKNCHCHHRLNYK